MVSGVFRRVVNYVHCSTKFISFKVGRVVFGQDHLRLELDRGMVRMVSFLGIPVDCRLLVVIAFIKRFEIV